MKFTGQIKKMMQLIQDKIKMYEENFRPTQSTEITSVPRYELDSTIHKWMFSNDEVLKEVERSLRGQVYNRKTRK